MNETLTLEYNQYQGAFHYNKNGNSPVIEDWVTICDNLSRKQANEFTTLMIEKYPQIDPFGDFRDSTIAPLAQTIKDEFEVFLLSDATI